MKAIINFLHIQDLWMNYSLCYMLAQRRAQVDFKLLTMVSFKVFAFALIFKV